MSRAIIVCCAVAFCGSVIKLLVGSAGGIQISKTISGILGVILLFTFVKTVFSSEPLPFSFYAAETDYEQINENMISDIINTAESEIEGIICKELKKEFGISPKYCNITINKDTFEIVTANITISRSDFLISTYEIEKFLKDNFQIEAEVFFA